MSAIPWQFHFRNCDVEGGSQPAHANWFYAYHAECAPSGLSTPDMPARGCCWTGYVEQPNPKGGELAAVYNPNPVVVDPTLLLEDIVGGLKAAAYGLIYIATEGEDAEALNEACQSALNLSAAAVSQQISQIGTAQLLDYFQQNLKNAAAAVNLTPEQIISYAQYTMGLQPGTWGFIAGDEYCNRIENNNQASNNGAGWTIVRSTNSVSAKPDYKAAGCFMTKGSLIYLWDRWLLSGPNNIWGGTSTLWTEIPSCWWQGTILC